MLAAREDVGKALARIILKKRRRIRLVGQRYVEAVMRNKSVFGQKLACADIEPLVDLHRIGADHFPADLQSKSLRERGFARSSGSNDDDNLAHGVLIESGAYDRTAQIPRTRFLDAHIHEFADDGIDVDPRPDRRMDGLVFGAFAH